MMMYAPINCARILNCCINLHYILAPMKAYTTEVLVINYLIGRDFAEA